MYSGSCTSAYLVFINKGVIMCVGFHDTEYSGCGYMGC